MYHDEVLKVGMDSSVDHSCLDFETVKLPEKVKTLFYCRSSLNGLERTDDRLFVSTSI